MSRTFASVQQAVFTWGPFSVRNGDASPAPVETHAEKAVDGLKALGRDVVNALTAPAVSSVLIGYKDQGGGGKFLKSWTAGGVVASLPFDVLRLALLPVALTVDVGYAAVHGSLGGIDALTKR